MVDMLKLASILMSAYGVYGIFSGQVYSNNSISTTLLYRTKEPVLFWIAWISYILVGCLIYFALAHKYG